MKHVSQIAKHVVENRQWTERDAVQAEDVLSELWIRLVEIFGNKLTSQYGDIPPDTWARALASCSAADIGTGIKACLESGREWPPSLGEFMKLCKPPKRENAGMYAMPPSRQLPHKLDDEARERGSKAIEEMKARLR